MATCISLCVCVCLCVESDLLIHLTPELLATSTEYTVISIISFTQLQITLRNVMNIFNKI